MTAAAAAVFHLDAQDVKTQDTSDSDSDSGQGSCEMSFRSQISKGVASVDEGDSDEEICVRKRIKCRRVLADSNSEGEGGNPEKLKVAANNVESAKEKYNWLGNKDSVLSYHAGVNSDVSDTEDLLPPLQLGIPEREDKSLNRKEMKEKSSSRKRKRKEEKKRKTTRQARKKEKSQEQKNGEDCPFNDSGCLLTDKELFDNGLEEEEEEVDGSPFQVGNLEMSINTAEKVKTKKRKLFLESEDYQQLTDESEGLLLKESRKRKLKPAKLTKEENRQLHSESQRLVREAAMTLPYHLPEAKSVQEFFKHKPRPSFQGSAMTLLKSMKTQPNSFQEDNVTGNSSISCHSNGKEQPLQPGILDQPNSGFAGSSSAEETEHLIGDCLEEDKQNEGSKAEFSEDLSSRKEGELNEVPADSIKPPEEGNIVEEREVQSLELPGVPQEPVQDLEPLVEIPGDKIKKSRLDRLRKLGVDLSIKPKLCSGMEPFIDLDEPEPNRELEALKERFVKHAFHMAKPKTEQRMVSVNIIRKEVMNDGKEELKADVVPVMLATEMVQDAARTKPGEKLQALKAKLQAAMKLRRTEERQKRHALFKLDNEVMEEEEEEEEEEMSDELEEEEEEEEEEEVNQEDPDGLGEMEEEHEELGEKDVEDEKETDKESADEDETTNVGLPCSVVSKPASTESTLLLFKDNSSKIGCFLAGEKVELEEALSKRAEKQDDEDSFLLPTLAKENSHNSSFELIGSMIPSYQPCNKQMGRGGHFFSAVGAARSPSPGFFKTSFLSSASKSSGKASEPSLPIEDSQDLYNVTPEEKSPVPTGGRFQFQFSLEDDTQSQLLDADGFLNVGPHRNKYQSCKSRLPLASMDENAMDANMGELFDLYSGQNQQSPNPGSGKKSDMEELLHLCSGKFPSQDSPLQSLSATSKLKRKRRTKDPGGEALSLFSNSFPPEREAEDKEKEEEFGEFQLLTDDHPFDSEEEDEKCKEEEEEEEEEESDQEEEGGDGVEYDDEEEELKRREGRKNKFNLKDFMEDEAELSGSEGGSEDEYDGEELNEYEEDVLDEILPEDGELHDQVNKIHMKMIRDDDKRQLRLYQERYLLDGDLHSDGPGRMRRFRWKNIDDAPEGEDLPKDADSGDDNENHLEETEAKWRKERFEREQWFREQSTKGGKEKEEEEDVDVDEDSQFMRLAKRFTHKSLQKKAPSAVAVQEIKSLPRNPFESFQPGSKPQLKNGSLLNQPRAVLQKLAAMSDLNPNAPRNSRNFVFQTLSPVKTEGVKEKAKPQVKRRTLPPAAMPSPKRLRLDSTSVQETRSIFQYLER
ncbi:claspin isoform X2 [Thamnophis elegans]|uniref:claspin isoform X2 n=1 Tax=Thamnophis elegans TaxID=35005 RepID=UPI001379019E|nr:claspin isoform X2 [Thamnophis elegans]